MGNFNPYAAPIAAAAVPQAMGVPARGQPQPWSVGEAIGQGWEVYKAQWAALTLGYFVVSIIGMLPGQVGTVLLLTHVVEPKSTAYYAINIPLTIFGMLLAQFFTTGFIRAALKATRSTDASFTDFFNADGRFLAFLGTTILSTLAIVVGLLLLIVPGVILALGFANAQYFCIDQRMGPIASLKESWASTDGQKGDLFLLSLASFGIMVVGVLACGVGVLVAMPLVVVVHAIVYTKMSGTAVGPAMPPAAGYGYYGPPGGAPPAAGPGYGGGPPGYGGGPPGYGGPPPPAGGCGGR